MRFPSEPPAGSVFDLTTTESGGMRLVWRPPRPGLAAWGAMAFLSFWLMGWAAGELFAIGALVALIPNLPPFNPQGEPLGWIAVLFLGGWLGGWTVGGYAASRAVRALSGKIRPESLTLELDTLHHVPLPIEAQFYSLGSASRSMPLRKGPQPRTVSVAEISALRLDQLGERQRLSIDLGADRHEIGPSLTEPEREWLAQVIATWSGLPLKSGDYEAES